MNLLQISLVLLFTLCNTLSCFGTFYQKVTDDGEHRDVSTQGFHQCSLKDNCSFVGIPVGNAGSKFLSASTLQELQVAGEKLDVWRKMQPEEPKDGTSSEKGKHNQNPLLFIQFDPHLVTPFV